jgi:hypothetical protein
LQAERYRLHHAIGALIAELAEQQPVVLVLDDLHWADAASLELVAHFLRRPPTGPVLLVLAYRSNQAPPELLVALAAAAREGSLTQIELATLGESAAEELLADIDASWRPAIYRESGGNPFYLEELARVHRARPRAPLGLTNDPGAPVTSRAPHVERCSRPGDEGCDRLADRCSTRRRRARAGGRRPLVSSRA